MQIIHLNHAQILSSALNKKPEDIQVVPPDTRDQDTAASPSTIVTLSDEGMALHVKEALATAKTISYIEKSDEEYAAMSYRQLIDERNGEAAGGRQEGDTSLKVMHLNGKADHHALMRLRDQQMANTANSKNLAHALNEFKAELAKNYSVSAQNIDITMKNGKPTLTGIADKNLLNKMQALLDDTSNNKSVALKNAVNNFNTDGLEMINMMIYEERIKFGGTNEAGQKVIHRTSELSMSEFVTNISYNNVAKSNGSFTWQKHQEVIGSTHYGVRYVYEK